MSDIRDLKNIMKEINEPNEYELFSVDLTHPYYWIFKVDDVRIKTIFPNIKELRKPSARFDVFINGLFIAQNDYIFEPNDNNFIIKFIKNNFPEFDRFGNPYVIDDTDEVKIKGDIEKFK
jgi:hypothetical protein